MPKTPPGNYLRARNQDELVTLRQLQEQQIQQVVIDVNVIPLMTIPPAGQYLGRRLVYYRPGSGITLLTTTAPDLIDLTFTTYALAGPYDWIELQAAILDFSGVPFWWMLARANFDRVTTFAFPYTLPPVASRTSGGFRFKNTNNFPVVVNAFGTDLIGDTGLGAIAIAAFGWLELWSDGTQWWIVG